jgi:hypothetical protein
MTCRKGYVAIKALKGYSTDLFRGLLFKHAVFMPPLSGFASIRYAQLLADFIHPGKD